MIDRRSTGPAKLQRVVEGLRDQVRLRFPRALTHYQRLVRPHLPGDTRHYEFSEWTRRGVEILQRLGTVAIHFERNGIWIEDLEGGQWLYTPGLFGSALWSEYGVIYEQDEIELLATLLSPDSVMVDVGANIGLHSIKLSQRIPGLKVFGFEPVGTTFQALQRNAARNGIAGLHIEQVAISDHDGKLKMTANFRAGNFVVPEGLEAANGHVESVSTKRLDTFIATLTDRIDLIKCDVEGHEMAVLKGAGSTLDKFRPMVFVEVMERYARRYGYATTDVFELMSRHGYTYQCVVDGRLEPASNTPMADMKKTTNFLFSHSQGRHG